MIDYLEKARINRITALSLHQNASAMFFPEERTEAAPAERSVMQVSKPLFVRSASLVSGAPVDAPAPENVANSSRNTLVLTEDCLVEEVMRQAA